MTTQDTRYASPATKNSTPPIYAVDFGTGSALAIYGPEGPVPKRSLALPRIAGGKTPRDEFRLVLGALLSKGDVVIESPTVGSSGCEADDVREVVSLSTHRLYTLSARTVKNYRMDFNIPNPKAYGKYTQDTSDSAFAAVTTQDEAHILDAEILYRVATERRERLRVWREADPCERVHKSVRPMDKRGYRDERSDSFMALLPSFSSLPEELRDVLGTSKGDYSRSLIMPFAMALTEPYLHDGPPDKARRRFEKILGLYDHGYPSFYRRMTVDWMQAVAKDLAGVTRMQDVPRETRKQAWKITQRQIRHLFHLSVNK